MKHRPSLVAGLGVAGPGDPMFVVTAELHTVEAVKHRHMKPETLRTTSPQKKCLLRFTVTHSLCVTPPHEV